MPADPPTARAYFWFKSSYSGGNATECLEAAFVPGKVLIRDSKCPAGARLAISPEAWASFLAAAAS